MFLHSVIFLSSVRVGNSISIRYIDFGLWFGFAGRN